MEDTFRKSMGWLHTWAGVVLGSVMFAMFWIGSLSVFDREIDRWMMPATRLAASPANFSLDRSVVPIARELAAASPQWLGFERPQLEISAFYLVWLASFAHAALRPRRAWREQTVVIAALAGLAVLLDVLTTGDHLSHVMQGQWAAAGMDGVLLLAVSIAMFAVRHMAQRKPVQRAVRSPSRNAELEHG